MKLKVLVIMKGGKMKMNKKGETSTLALIIGLIVLLIAAFLVIMAVTGNFGIFNDFVANMFGGKANVGTVVQGCQAACALGTQGTFDYCTKLRDVYFDKKSPKQSMTCKMMEGTNGLEVCPNVACNTAPATIPPATNPPTTTPPASAIA
jgi:hypothetical protein